MIMIKNSKSNFGLVSKLFHWLIALLMLVLLPLGYYMVDLTYYDPLYHQSTHWHKSIGVILGGLVLIKLIWRVYSPPPDAIHNSPPITRWLSKAVHCLLLLSTLLLPISGYLISTSAGDAIEVFNWFQMPALISIDETLRDQAIDFHYYGAYGIALVIAVHISAALMHHFFIKDGVLRRML